MKQNTSAAVMQQRKEPHDSLDDFPTPPWATRAFCEWLDSGGFTIDTATCREPAANRGHMVKPLLEYFGEVEASDIHDYGAGYPVNDYLFGPEPESVQFTITNPPFRLAEQFIARMISTSRLGCAVIVRAAFLEGIGRYERLFSLTPPTHILQHVERVPIVKGRYDPNVGSATAYAWLFWETRKIGRRPTVMEWIAPCRKRLEKNSDYIPIHKENLSRSIDNLHAQEGLF